MLNDKISIILPAYNEEKAIGQVVDNVIAVMSGNGFNFEIIVVDDASTDRTAEIAAKRGVRVIRHPVNKGVGAARKTGILNSCGNIIAMLDTDNTYPAESIPEILSFIPAYDQVIGARVNEYGRLKLMRSFMKRFIFCSASLLAGQKITDLNSGLRAMKKDTVMKYLHLIPDGFSCVSTMTLAFLYNGHTVKYVPIEYRERIGKSKFNILSDTLIMLWTIIRISVQSKLLRQRCI